MSLHDHRARHDWAQDLFGALAVGSRRRVRRVVAMAAQLAARPSATVTEVFDDLADREGAYRMLSNASVSSQALSATMCDATAQRCVMFRRVLVAVDGTALTLRERDSARGIGGVGAWNKGARGLQAMTALAMDEDGVPIGICSQRWWARTERSKRPRSPHRSEMRHHIDVVRDAADRLERQAPGCRPVFVMDRGFDCWSMVQIIANARFGVIMRAQQNRRLVEPRSPRRRYLRERLETSAVRGRYTVAVPARGDRPARLARMQLRARRVTIHASCKQDKSEPVTLNAVLAQEVGGPKGAALSWMLLTNEPIDSFEQLVGVVRDYERRWRIEEMHRVWKRGGGHIEDTQLRSREAIIKWATLHCAVATRAVRLAQLARTKPDTPASEEFTQDEIDAAIVLRRARTKLKVGDAPTLAGLVRMVADIGGYTGRSSGGPPGPTVIARGLERIATAAEVVAALRSK